MNLIKKINDYSLELSPDSNNIPDLAAVLNNLKKIGNKKQLNNYITSIYNLGLPYRHTICVSDDGEVVVAIFEKDHKKIQSPEKIKIGIIQNYRN